MSNEMDEENALAIGPPLPHVGAHNIFSSRDNDSNKRQHLVARPPLLIFFLVILVPALAAGLTLGLLVTLPDRDDDCNTEAPPINASDCTIINPEDVFFLASDELNGRDNGSPGSLAAQQYIIDQLQPIAQGLVSASGGRDSFQQALSTDKGINILGVIPGSGELQADYILLGAHYDHVNKCKVICRGDKICNCATDNAVGVAAVLGIGRVIAALNSTSMRQRSVVLAFWDQEEDGLLGSKHYVANPLVPLNKTITYLNFDALGTNLLPSLRNWSFTFGPETGGNILQNVLNEAIADESLDVRSLGAMLGNKRSDCQSFVDAGISTIFFTDFASSCTHTTGDEINIIDFGKLERQARIGLKTTLALSNITNPPEFTTSNLTVSFDDAIVVNDMVNLMVTDRDLFQSNTMILLTGLKDSSHKIVSDGSENFSYSDKRVIWEGAIAMLNKLTQLECNGFLIPAAT